MYLFLIAAENLCHNWFIHRCVYETDVNEYIDFKRSLESLIDTDKYQVLLKPHQVVYKELKKSGRISDSLIPAFVDTNELLSITDVLISDYSSIFYDFLATGKPVVFYIPDLEEYKNYRGLYLAPEQLPGPCLTNIDEIGKVINNLDFYINKYQIKYNEAKAFGCPMDDGNVAKRIVAVSYTHLSLMFELLHRSYKWHCHHNALQFSD